MMRSTETCNTSVDNDRTRQIQLILSQINELPTLSPIATRLMEIGSDDEANLSEITALIQSDPALTSKILGLCKRAERGLGNRITTVDQAVKMIGLKAVQAAVLSVSVYELLNQTNTKQVPGEYQPGGDESDRTFDRVGFWMFSIAVASCAQLISQQMPSPAPAPDEAFVAGLLHDLGRQALDFVLPRTYPRIIELAESARLSGAQAEQRVLGLDHHEAGKQLAEHWQLPTALRDVMWLHGQPMDALPENENRTLIGIVTLAIGVCRTIHLGFSGDCCAQDETKPIAKSLGLKQGALGRILHQLPDIVAEKCNSLGIEGTTSPGVLMNALSSANRKLGRLTLELNKKPALVRTQPTDHVSLLEKTLSTIEQFTELSNATDSPVRVMGLAGSCLCDLLGKQRHIGLWFDREQSRWEAHVLCVDGQLKDSAFLGPMPLESMDQIELTSRLLAPTGWVQSTEPMAVINLFGDETEPLMLLIRLGDDAWDALPDQLRDTLVKVWAHAGHVSLRRSSDRRLTDQLAASNRRIMEVQDELARAQSLARLGMMASGAAHEMNNPLTVISGYAQLLVDRITTEPEAQAVSAIVDAACDLTDLITSLHLLAEPPTPNPQETTARQIVETAINMARSRTCLPIDAQFSPNDDADDAVVCDRELAARSLCELITNAQDATDNKIVQIQAQTDHGNDRLEFVVQDSGSGMNEHTLEHAFDPFFSDKPAGRQTGLGLSRALRLAQQLGGEILLYSVPDVGTKAVLLLPVMPAQSQNRAA